MRIWGLTGLDRGAHALAMAAFGAGVYALLWLATPVGPMVAPGGWLGVEHPLAPLVLFTLAVACLGDLLWVWPQLHQHPLVVGCLFSLVASVAFGVSLSLVFEMSGPAGLVDAVGGGLVIGLFGSLVTFPITPLLGALGVLLSFRVQRWLGFEGI